MLIYFMVAVIVAGYMPELFPTASRMRGNAITSVAGRLTAIHRGAVRGGGAVQGRRRRGGSRRRVGGAAAQVVLAAAYREETNGRSLEAIAADAEP